MSRILFPAAAGAFLIPAISLANTDVAFEDVPENVLATAQLTAPGVDFDRVSIEVENGAQIYEFEGADHEGKHIEIDVYETGELEEIEMETDISDVPGVVIATLNVHAPGFEPSYIELSIRQSKPAYVYEFEGDYEGKFVEIEISEDGDLVYMSDPDASPGLKKTATTPSTVNY